MPPKNGSDAKIGNSANKNVDLARKNGTEWRFGQQQWKDKKIVIEQQLKGIDRKCGFQQAAPGICLTTETWISAAPGKCGGSTFWATNADWKGTEKLSVHPAAHVMPGVLFLVWQEVSSHTGWGCMNILVTGLSDFAVFPSPCLLTHLSPVRAQVIIWLQTLLLGIKEGRRFVMTSLRGTWLAGVWITDF